jgi:hypothetical protein
MNKARRKPKGIIAKCIYCSETKEVSKEHYLPEGLGRFKNFEALNDRICKDCNNTFGRAIEEQFCRGGEIGFMRYALGIKGKEHHNPVNPFMRGSAGMRAYDMKAKMFGGNQEVLFQLIPGSRNDAEYLPHMRITTYEDEVHYIRIPPDMTDPAALLGELKRRGIGKFKEVYVHVPTSERERVDKLIAVLNVQKPGEWGESPMGESPVRIDAVTKYDVDDRFFRAVAKIGFHYLLKNFHYRGDEDMFADIRNFIMKGEGDVKKFVNASKEKQIIEQVKWGMVPNLDCHIVTAETTPDSIFSRMQFFLGPDTAVPHVYTATLATPETALYSEMGHIFCYYPEGPQDGFAGTMGKLDSGHRIMRVAL